jgi:hypothetical protein
MGALIRQAEVAELKDETNEVGKKTVLSELSIRL